MPDSDANDYGFDVVIEGPYGDGNCNGFAYSVITPYDSDTATNGKANIVRWYSQATPAEKRHFQVPDQITIDNHPYDVIGIHYGVWINAGSNDFSGLTYDDFSFGNNMQQVRSHIFNNSIINCDVIIPQSMEKMGGWIFDYATINGYMAVLSPETECWYQVGNYLQSYLPAQSYKGIRGLMGWYFADGNLYWSDDYCGKHTFSFSQEPVDVGAVYDIVSGSNPKQKITLRLVPSGLVSDFDIPSTVTAIGSTAFQGSQAGLVSIPQNVNVIYHSAFCNSVCNILFMGEYNGLRMGNEYDPTPGYLLLRGEPDTTWLDSKSVTFSGKNNRILYGGEWLTEHTPAYDLSDYGGSIIFQSSDQMIGSNLVYSITDGSLVVDGTGNTFSNYSDENRPGFYDQRDSITSLQLDSTVDTIYPYVFSFLTNLRTIYIGASTNYSEASFGDNPNLDTICVKGSEAEDHSSDYLYAPWKISSSTAITIDLKDSSPVGAYMFKDAANVTRLIIRNGDHTFGAHSFDGCVGLTELTYPAGYALVLGADAFKDCSSLDSIQLPMSQTYPESSFSGCNAISSMTLTGTTGPSGKQENAPWFTTNSRITLIIPNDSEVTAAMFQGCTSLQTLDLSSFTGTIGAYAFQGCTGLTDLTVGSSGTINTTSFNGLTGLEKLTIPLTRTHDAMFSDLSSLSLVLVTASGTAVSTSYANDYANTPWYIASHTSGNSGFTVSLPSGLTSIGDSMFYQASKLPAIELGSGITEIGANAFNGCSSLESITMVGSQPTVGAWAFETGRKAGGQYTTLECVFENTKTEYDSWMAYLLSNGAYSDSTTDLRYLKIDLPGQCGTNLTFVLSGSKLMIKGYGAMYDLDENGVIQDGGSTVIGWFSIRADIDCLVFPSGLTYIGDYAFAGFSSLDYANIPSSVTEIGDASFKGCVLLKAADIPNVRAIGNDAFNGCSSMEWIRTYYNTSVGTDAFDGVNGMRLYVSGASGTTGMGQGLASVANTMKAIMLNGIESSFCHSGIIACISGEVFSSDSTTLATSFITGKVYWKIEISEIESDDNKYTAATMSTISF